MPWMPATVRRRPHVLALINNIADGGAERVAVNLATRADPSRFRCSLCVTRPLSYLPGEATELNLERLRAEGVDVLLLDRRSRYSIASWGPLVGYLRSQKVDLVHGHMFGSNVWGAVLGRLIGVPVVIAHEHTWSFEGQAVRRLIDRRVVARLADAVIAVSEADRRRMIEEVGMPSNRVVLIPNGTPSPPQSDGAAVREELNIAADAPLLAMTAVVRPQKAIDVMVRAMAILCGRHPDARLVVMGPGDSGRLRALASEIGVADAVTFTGHRSDVADVLGAATVGVLSSDYEGTPLAVLEYMAAGLPVVATDVGGLPQIVENGRTGLLVPKRDPSALAAAIEKLLIDRELARSMGERGRARQQSEFSSEVMSERVYRLYESLLATRGLNNADRTERMQRADQVRGRRRLGALRGAGTRAGA
jgi:glycosyltransferase involved in cell wall biosynthesis